MFGVWSSLMESKLAIISADSVGNILSVNEYACGLFGIPKEEFVGMSVRGTSMDDQRMEREERTTLTDDSDMAGACISRCACVEIMPRPYREQHDDYMRNYMLTRQPRVLGKSRSTCCDYYSSYSSCSSSSSHELR